MGAMTSIGTFTKITDSEWGNKRIWIGTLHTGDGTSTWPGSSGFTLRASDFNMDSIDAVFFDAGTQVFKSIPNDYAAAIGYYHAYVAHATPGATVNLIISEAAVHETIRLLVIGNGGGS